MPDNGYSRADYIRALLNQRQATEQNGSPLINPAVEQAAVLDNSFQGKTPVSNPNERNGWQRFWDTANEAQLNVSRGFMNFFDSIGDAFINIAGGITQAFGGDTSWADIARNSNWNEKAAVALNRLMPAGYMMSGDFFNGENGYWDWTNLGGAEKAIEAGSYINEIESQDVQNVIRSMEQGVGNILPNIALATLTGGTSAVGLGAAALQGFGAGSTEALNEGANYGQALASGAISGAIEAGTEKLSDVLGFTKNLFMPNVKEGAKVGIKATLKAAFSEGMEEFVSEMLSPYTKAPYKGIEQANKTTFGIGSEEWFSLLKDAGIAFAGGAAGGLVGSVAGGQGQFTKQERAILDKIDSFHDVAHQEFDLAKNPSQEGLQDKLNGLNDQAGKLRTEILADLDTLKNSDQRRYERFIKMLKDPADFKSKEFKKLSAEEQVNKARESFEQRLEPDVYESLRQYYEDAFSNTKLGTKIKYVPSADFRLDDGTVGRARYNKDTNTIEVNELYKTELGALVRHEGLIHAVAHTDPEIVDRLLETLKGEKLLSDKELANRGYKKSEYNEERLAHWLENHLSAEAVEKLFKGNRIARLNLKSILARIKNNMQLSKKHVDLDSKVLREIDKAIKAIDNTKVDYEKAKQRVNRGLHGETQFAYAKIKGEENEKEYKNKRYVFDRENAIQISNDLDILNRPQWQFSEGLKAAGEKRLVSILKGEASIFENNPEGIINLIVYKNAIKKMGYNVSIPDYLWTPEMHDMFNETYRLTGEETIFYISNSRWSDTTYGEHGLGSIEIKLVYEPLTVIEINRHERVHAFSISPSFQKSYVFPTKELLKSRKKAYDEMFDDIYKRYGDQYIVWAQDAADKMGYDYLRSELNLKGYDNLDTLSNRRLLEFFNKTMLEEELLCEVYNGQFDNILRKYGLLNKVNDIINKTNDIIAKIKNMQEIRYAKDPVEGKHVIGDNGLEITVNKVARGYDIVVPNQSGEQTTIHKADAKEVQKYLDEMGAKKKVYEKSASKGKIGKKVDNTIVLENAPTEAQQAQADAMWSNTNYGDGKTVYYKDNGVKYEAKITGKKVGTKQRTLKNGTKKTVDVKKWSARIKNENGGVETKDFANHYELKKYFQQFPVRSNDASKLEAKVDLTPKVEEVTAPKTPKTAKERVEEIAKEAVEEYKNSTVEKPVKRTEDIKNYAKANYESFISMKSSEDVAKMLTSMVQLELGKSNIKVKPAIKEVSGLLFENYNKYHGAKGKLNDVVREWLNSQVIFDNSDKTTINEIFKLDGASEENINDFISDLSNDILSALQEKTQSSRMGKLRKLMTSRIAHLQERIMYYRNVAVSVVKTIARANKIADITKNPSITNLRSHYGLNSLQYDFIKNTFSGGITASKSSKGFSPASVTRVVNSLGWYDQHTLESVFPWYEFNPEVAQYIKDIKNSYVELKDGTKGLQGQVSLENTVKFNDIVNEIYKLTRSIEREAKAADLRAHHQAFTEWDIIKEEFNVNPKNFLANAASKIFRETASPASTYASRFGSNSEMYKVLVTDISDSNSAHLNKMVEFKNEYLKIAQKYDLFKIKKLESFSDYQKVQNKIADVLKKEVSVEIEHTNTGKTETVKLPLGVILDMYMHAQTIQGYNTLLNGGYDIVHRKTTYNLHHLSAETIDRVEDIVREHGLKEFGDEVSEKLYNGILQEYKLKSDEKNFGVSNILSGDIYYPNNKSLADVEKAVDNTFSNYKTNPANWGNNKENTGDTWHALKGMDFEERLDNYLSSLTVYGEMFEACNNFDSLTSQMLKYGKADNYIRGLEDLTKYYANQIAGRPVNRSGVGTGKLYGNVVSATLGGNISVMMKQTASLPTIMNEVRLSSFVKGLSGITNIAKYGDVKSQVAEVSGLLALRWGKNEVIRSATLASTVSKFAKVFGAGMEFVDSAVILTVGFRSAQFEAEAVHGYKVGTKENTDAAIKILERIVAKTQSNSINLEMSMARSGAAGIIPKVLSVFSSDLQNKISYINQLFTEKHFAELRNKGALELKDKIETKIGELRGKLSKYDDLEVEELEPAERKEYLDAKAKLEDAEQTLSEINKSIDNNNELINDKTRTGKQVKLLTSLALSAAMIVGIEQLVKRLLGRKGWDEDEDPQEIAKAFLLESTVFNLPYVSQIYNAFDYDKEIGVFDMNLLNEGISLARKLADAVQNQDQPQKWVVPLIKVLGDLTGFPMYNLYNLGIGAVKWFDMETGTKWDSAVRGYSSTYLTGAYKSAVKNNGLKTAKNYLQLDLTMYKSGKADDRVVKELNDLFASGYDVLPKNYVTTYTDETGEKVKFSDEQIGIFKQTYQTANDEVKNLLDVTDYQNATQEEKAKAIRSIYNLYYNVARAKAIGSADGLGKMAKMVYYSNGAVPMAKYIAILNKLATIEATDTKTKKELTVDYINKLKGLSKKEKLLLMYLNGYKLNDENLNILKTYLSSRGITKSNLKKLFE